MYKKLICIFLQYNVINTTYLSEKALISNFSDSSAKTSMSLISL